jgi:glycine hydroxymethyltransferase
MSYLMEADPEVAEAIRRETRRQSGKLEMIASENFVSEAVLEAQGSVMTNKYAEGYPGRRYYGGCEFVDIVERLAIERSKQLFGAEHANVQPHAGVQANMAVYFTVLEPGDTILGMNLSHGGHLSHGSPASFSGKFYRGVFYGVDRKTETIDFNEVETLARQHRPKIIVVGASAYPRTIDYEKFRVIAAKAVALKEALTEDFKQYQRQILKNAKTLADGLLEDGFRLVSGGTDNHMMLVDLTDLNITGKEAQETLDRTGITINKNRIPFDTKGAQVTSGIRVGTPALTTRGMKEPEMKRIAGFISAVLRNIRDEGRLTEIREEVRSLCGQFPLYPERIRENR